MRILVRYREWFMWWIVAFLALIALFLGTFGSIEYLSSQSKYAGFPDAFYRACQLFAFNFYDAGPLPWKLEIARWIAPAATLGALFKSIASVVGGHGVQWKLARLTHHVILTGTRSAMSGDDLGTRITVAAVLDTPRPPIRLSSCRILVTAPDMESLASECGVDRAASVLIDAKSIDEGLAWLHAIYSHCSSTGRTGLDITVFLPEASMCSRLDVVTARFEPQLRMVYLTRADLQASKFCQALGKALSRNIEAITSEIELALIGSPTLCHAAAKRLAALLIAEPARTIKLHILCRGEMTSSNRSIDWTDLIDFAPQLRWKVSANAMDEEIANALRSAQSAGICCDTADETLTALDLSKRFGIGTPPPTVVLISGDWLARNIHQSLAEDNVIPVVLALDDELAAAATSPSLDAMAQAIHQHYLDSNPGNSPAAVAWSELPVRYRQSSRLQAESLMFKLLALGNSIESASSDSSRLAKRIKDDIETLSEAEHLRWMTEKKLRGWIYGERRNDHLMHHPSLIPYADLPDEEKEKDRAMWLLQPQLLNMQD